LTITTFKWSRISRLTSKCWNRCTIFIRDAPIPIPTNSNSNSRIGIGRNWLELELELVGIDWNWNWNWSELTGIGIGIGRNWLELELELVGIGRNWSELVLQKFKLDFNFYVEIYEIYITLTTNFNKLRPIPANSDQFRPIPRIGIDHNCN
jgi:hypothetical protein